MALYGISFTITYTAWDAVNNVGKTGDVANHTLRWVKDGTSSAPSNSPSEIDSTNAPGQYKLVLTATEAQAVFGSLAGKSSTSGVSIMPVSVAFERLPNVDPGANGGLPTVNGSNYVAGVVADVGITQAGADKSWSTTTRALTDKVGFALSAGGVAAIWDALTSGMSTAGSIGKRIIDFLTGDVYARLGAPAGASTAADIAAVKSDTAAVKTKTDQFVFTIANRVDSQVKGVDTGVVDAAAVATDAVNEIRDAITGATIEGSMTLAQFLRFIGAMSAGKLSGAATTTVVIRNASDTANAITATVDADGNRSAVTINV